MGPDRLNKSGLVNLSLETINNCQLNKQVTAEKEQVTQCNNTGKRYKRLGDSPQVHLQDPSMRAKFKQKDNAIHN